MNIPFKQAVLLAAALAGAATAAPVKAGKLGFVDVQKVIEGTSAGASFTAISKKADGDLAAQVKAIQALQAKLASGKGSAADRQALIRAQTAYQTSARSYDAQRQKAFAPVASKVNAALTKTARAQGYSVVFDRRKAASGLVIYANTQTTDLTAAVQKALKK